MRNNYLSVLYQHIIQEENKNVGIKVEGHKHTIASPPPPPNQKCGDTVYWQVRRNRGGDWILSLPSNS